MALYDCNQNMLKEKLQILSKITQLQWYDINDAQVQISASESWIGIYHDNFSSSVALEIYMYIFNTMEIQALQ